MANRPGSSRKRLPAWVSLLLAASLLLLGALSPLAGAALQAQAGPAGRSDTYARQAVTGVLAWWVVSRSPSTLVR